MPSGLTSPRNRDAVLADLGERSAFVDRQRVGRPRRRRAARRARLRRLAGFIALTGLSLVVALAGGRWLLTTQRFAVARVEVRGASRMSPEQVMAAAAIPRGTNIFRLDTTNVIDRIEALPEVRRADVVRELPDRVVISVEERRPFTLVRHNAYYSNFDATAPTIGEMAGYLNQIISNPFEKVHVDSVDIQSTISQQARPQTITRVLSASSLAPKLKSRSLLPARRGSLVHLRVYLRPQVALGQPQAPEHAVDLTVRVPRRGILGVLTVTGGRPNLGCAFCIGEENGVPYSGLKTFDGLLSRLNAKPRHSDLVAGLRMFPGGLQASAKSSQHAVIVGGKTIRILAQ